MDYNYSRILQSAFTSHKPINSQTIFQKVFEYKEETYLAHLLGNSSMQAVV